ncbi:hypothetical protein PR202_gb00032 [Eleusine coracana subsp. coracana]|uniref:Uncharacterized protein n=1 Tax=Eleusine coracana subsp. coracana TaxID=191504 RepID=A0AAV5DSU8_ELECO|nr:hypothetical protein PR202_gb00032 [Eleusine coracana subsp. coracana]
MRSWPRFTGLPRAESMLCWRSWPPGQLREMFPASMLGSTCSAGSWPVGRTGGSSKAEALRCPWFDEVMASPVAEPDHPRVTCSTGCSSSVSSVAEAILASNKTSLIL